MHQSVFIFDLFSVLTCYVHPIKLIQSAEILNNTAGRLLHL